MPSTRRIRAFLVATACLLWAAAAQAQVTLDPRTAEFNPSPDHNSPTLVVRYDLELYFIGAAAPFQTVSLGKPTPQGDGKIRVDLATVLGAFLPAGQDYESRVTAVSNASMVGRSGVSNQFAFTASCAASISPLSSSVGGGAATGSLTVNAASGCTWTASSMVSWITITGGATGTGNGTVTYSVAANPTTTPRTGTVAAAGQTFTLNQAGACSFNITPTSASWPASPSTGSVAVTTTAGCAWTATSPVTWITLTGATSGTGNGTVNYSVAANTGTASRNATLSIAGRAFTVTQAGVVCTPSLSATDVTVGAGGGPGTVGVTAAAGCTWTASSGASWLTVTGGSPGNGNGTVAYNVAPNGSASSRTGTLTIAGQTYTVTQEGVTCSFSLSPTSSSVPAASSTGSVSVTAPGGCTWNAVSGASWITVTSGGSGSGNGTVGYSVAANTTLNPRSGSITIGGQTFTINQAAAPCNFSISPTSASAPSGASSSTITVTVATGCAWTAVSNASWITVTAGGSGNGNGTVSYSVAANPNTTGRSGTITVAGQTYTVNQAGVPCAFSIAPTGSSVAAAATTGTVGVTAQTGCAWTAVSNATWITVTAGGSGSGNGSVSYSVAANTNTAGRSGTITIAGQTFTVTQAGVPCSYTLSPTTVTLSATGGNRTVGVTAQAGCTWTATPSASWITITAGGSGSGNGTVSYTVAANPSTSGRTGSIAVGGQLLTITQSGAPCAFSITPGSVSVDANAATGTVAVTAQAGCAWTAVSNATWITVTGGASGNGNGTVSYSIAANTTITGRTGTITIAGQTFTVTQAGIPCTFTIAPTGASVGAGASSSTVAVTAPTGCNWTATSNQTWATITGGASGSGNGTVSYSVAANGTPSPRAATLTIAGHAFALTQAGGTCNFAVAPTSDNVPAAGGSGRTVAVTVQTGCAWTATESASWITITAGGSGSGNGTVTYSVAANTSTSSRSSTIAIGSQVVTVTQQGAACAYTINPASVTVGSNASSGTLNVGAQSGCPWTASSNAPWLTITAGGSGNGNGAVNYSVSANPGTGRRTGIVTVQGQGASAQTLTVDQDGVPCNYGLSPTTENVPAAGGNRTVAMTAQGGCAWTATPSASWITITAGGSGSGNGTISYTVAPNASTSGRTGTIAAGGQLLTITQAGAACALSIAPGSVSVNANATTGTVAVTGQTGCAWTAVSNAAWITVTGGASGSGNGTVSYSIAANPGTSDRTGTVTIAGQTFTVTQGGAPCTFAISPTGTSVGAAATSSTVAVTAPGGCAWSATSNASWITVTAGGTGSGNGTVSYSIGANPSTTGRTGTVTIAGQTFTVTQAGVVCTFSVSPTTVALSSAATSLSIDVTTGGSCAWSASSAATWITFSGGGGPGSGDATFNVSANTTGAERTGTLTVAGQTVTVTQVGGTCTYSISPSLVNVGADATTIPVTVTTPGNCPWSSSSPAPWATFPSGGTGAGTGTVTVAVASNPGSVGRLTNVTIAGRTLVINQAGRLCSYSLAPTAVTVGPEGVTGSFAVTASDECAWTPTTTAPWINVSGAGTGNGTVTYTVQPNTSGAQRSANIQVGNRTFAITQAGACDYSISPTDVTLGETAGSGTVAVTTGAGCSWTASSGASWITITSGSSGSGGGSVSYSVAANPSGTPRTGILNIAGEVFTVIQSSCDFTVTPGSVTEDAAGGTNYALVRTGASCGWSASSSASWITFTGTTSGSGTDWVQFRVAANSNPDTRTGSVTVSGESISVVQNGSCTFIVSPQTFNVGGSGNVLTAGLTTGPGCNWTASSQASWITINSGSTSGTGSATPTFTVAANTGSTARTGTVRIGGVTVSIVQAPAGPPTTPAGLRVIK